MRHGYPAIVAIGGRAELYLQHLTGLLEDFYGVIDCGKAGSGIGNSDAFVNFAYRRVTITGEKHFE